MATSCGGSTKKTPSASGAGTSASAVSTTTATPAPAAPLTGLPQPDAALRNRPVLAVKIDNHPLARPQFGLEKADDVMEERVEGGLTRFMALFQSQDADRLGPVRSLRSTDAAWLQPEGGMIAYSGGIDPVKALLGPAGIVDLGGDNHGPTYYKRRSDRPYEHSMYVNTTTLRTLTPANLAGPKPLFQYLVAGQTFGGAGMVPATGITVQVSTQTTFDWTWDAAAGLFRRGTNGTPHTLEGAGQIGMRNVIVQFTQYRATPWRDAANSAVDEAVVVGSGDAWILSNGQIVRGHWSRPTAGDLTSYTDSSGAPVLLAPGQTWISLVPPGQPTQVRP